jgi:hypothetical protein
MKHLIIHTDKDLKILDWTPFTNNDELNFRNRLIKEGDLIVNGLDVLSKYGWKLKHVFITKKEPHFLCINKKTETQTLDNQDDNQSDSENESYIELYSQDKTKSLYDDI